MTKTEFRALEKTNPPTGAQQNELAYLRCLGAAELLGLKPSTLSYRMKVLGIEKK